MKHVFAVYSELYAVSDVSIVYYFANYLISGLILPVSAGICVIPSVEMWAP